MKTSAPEGGSRELSGGSSEAIAAMSVSQEMMKSFDGSSGVEVETWLRKIKLVARLKKITALHEFLPLYLEGAAFAIYDQLSDKDKEDGSQIEKALLSAFAQDNFGAYDTFRQRSWLPGESVDVYLADLWRLARLAKVASDELVRCAFICGLPSDVSARLRATANISSTDLPTVAEQARIYLANGQYHNASVSVVGKGHEQKRLRKEIDRGQSADDVRGADNWKKNRTKIECYNCGGDHLARHCKNVTCWKCGNRGHRSRECSGNA